MKNLLILLLLIAGASCEQSDSFRVNQRIDSTNKALLIALHRIHDLEQEQTFQFKDIDSTKRALGVVALVALEAHGVAVRVDSTVRIGRDKAGKRTAVVMEVATWIPFLAPFIRKR
jgi:hypothetical protein